MRARPGSKGDQKHEKGTRDVHEPASPRRVVAVIVPANAPERKAPSTRNARRALCVRHKVPGAFSVPGRLIGGLLVAIALYGLSLRGCCALEREVQGNHPLSPRRGEHSATCRASFSARRSVRSTSGVGLRLARKACWVEYIPEPRDQQRAGKQAHDPAAADFVRFSMR